MKVGGNRVVAGATELVTAGSSFMILFYFVFDIRIHRHGHNKYSPQKE
jgi:hypothetical protein